MHDVGSLLGSPVAFHSIFAKIAGGATHGLFLSQAYYWSSIKSDSDGWFYKSGADWEEETGLSRRERDGARAALGPDGLKVLEERRDYSEHRVYFRVDMEALEVMCKTYITSVQNVQNQCAKRTEVMYETYNSNVQNVQLINRLTENTAETTQRPSRDARAHKAETIKRFGVWFEECWLALPKAARVDKSDARIVAGDIQEEEWVGVLTAARNFALSDIVKRSMVWHASRFFREGNWKLYEDGPVFDSFALNGNGNGNGHTNGHGPPGESMFERAAEPPAGYSHDKTPDGRWRRMSRNSDTGLYPYDCDNLGDALGIERRMYGGKA